MTTSLFINAKCYAICAINDGHNKSMGRQDLVAKPPANLNLLLTVNTIYLSPLIYLSRTLPPINLAKNGPVMSRI